MSKAAADPVSSRTRSKDPKADLERVVTVAGAALAAWLLPADRKRLRLVSSRAIKTEALDEYHTHATLESARVILDRVMLDGGCRRLSRFPRGSTGPRAERAARATGGLKCVRCRTVLAARGFYGERHAYRGQRGEHYDVQQAFEELVALEKHQRDEAKEWDDEEADSEEEEDDDEGNEELRSALREATIVVGDPYFFHPDSDRHEKWADYERACRCYERIKPEPYEVPTDAPLVLRRLGYSEDQLGSRTFYEYAGDAQHLLPGAELYCSKGCVEAVKLWRCSRCGHFSRESWPRCHVRYCENGGDQYSNSERYCARCFSPRSCSTCGKGPWCPCNFIPCCVDGCKNVMCAITHDGTLAITPQERADQGAPGCALVVYDDVPDDDDEGRPPTRRIYCQEHAPDEAEPLTSSHDLW